MTTARAVIISAIIIALTIVGVAWWAIRSQPQPERYQLVNVGAGETQRIDKITGTIARCSDGRCEALTNGEAVIEKPADASRSDGADVPPPPPGFSVDTP